VVAAFERSGLVLAVAAATAILGYENGAFGIGVRSGLAIAAWWAVGLAIVVGLWPLAPIPRAALACGGLLAAFAAWTLASIAWAPSAEAAFLEFDRVALYLAIFMVAVLAATRRNVARWVDGLAVGVVAIALVGLSSRLFPELFDQRKLLVFLPTARARLSFPVQYWNGLGILTGLALPLLLRAAVCGRTALARGAALAPVPALVATVYLTSSRGGAATALVGAIVAIALAERRWTTVAALGVAAVGGAGSVLVLASRHELVNGLSTNRAASEGRNAAVLIALLALAAGAAWAVASRAIASRGRPRPLLGRALAAGAALVAVGGVLASHPGRRFETFKQPPVKAHYSSADFTKAHLLSGYGSGRWQFWGAAVDEWRSEPLHGRGAGSFESWWAQHGPISYFVRDAHSLYLETAGELGVVGLALLLAVLGAGTICAVVRRARADGEGRAAIAAVGGAFAGYLVGAGLDWMWELTIVSLIGFACLGLLVGPATETLREATETTRRGFGLGALVLLVGWLVLCAEGIPLLADHELNASARAAARGDVPSALADAHIAQTLEPWASTPYLQLALVAEDARDYGRAQAWVREAIRRDSQNWRPWLVSARIAVEAGDIATARRSLHRAAALDPRSPLFAGVRPGR
jgi:O-Antigen ligase